MTVQEAVVFLASKRRTVVWGKGRKRGGLLVSGSQVSKTMQSMTFRLGIFKGTGYLCSSLILAALPATSNVAPFYTRLI